MTPSSCLLRLRTKTVCSVLTFYASKALLVHRPALSDLVEEHLANLQINTFCLFMKIHEICIDVNGDEGEDNVRKMRFWYRGFSLSHRDEMSQRKPVTLHTYS